MLVSQLQIAPTTQHFCVNNNLLWLSTTAKNVNLQLGKIPISNHLLTGSWKPVTAKNVNLQLGKIPISNHLLTGSWKPVRSR